MSEPPRSFGGGIQASAGYSALDTSNRPGECGQFVVVVVTPVKKDPRNPGKSEDGLKSRPRIDNSITRAALLCIPCNSYA